MAAPSGGRRQIGRRRHDRRDSHGIRIREPRQEIAAQFFDARKEGRIR